MQKAQGGWIVILSTIGVQDSIQLCFLFLLVYLPKLLFLMVSHQPHFVWESCGLS